MDGARFESLTRRLATRRAVVRGLVGSGGVLVALRAGTSLAEPAEMVTICHKPGTPAQQTLVVASAAVKVHLGHGDSLGTCDTCSDGAMMCGGTGILTCDHNAWVYRECPSGTVCQSIEGIAICTWPTNP